MSPEQIRNTLLKSAREAGERYLHVRGVDLEAAITGQPVKPSPPAKTTGEPRQEK